MGATVTCSVSNRAGGGADGFEAGFDGLADALGVEAAVGEEAGLVAVVDEAVGEAEAQEAGGAGEGV